MSINRQPERRGSLPHATTWEEPLTAASAAEGGGLYHSAMIQVLERLACRAIGETQRGGSSKPI